MGSLREDVRRGGTTLPPAQTQAEVDYAWLSVLEAPERRRPTVPRMLLEGLFLAACATAAAIADLDAAAIAGVMIGAWVLVALIEWAASRADRRREELLLAGPPTRVAVEAAPPAADPAWYSPPVEQTMLDMGEVDATAVTRLPPPADELDATIEQTHASFARRAAAPGRRRLTEGRAPARARSTRRDTGTRAPVTLRRTSPAEPCCRVAKRRSRGTPVGCSVLGERRIGGRQLS